MRAFISLVVLVFVTQNSVHAAKAARKYQQSYQPYEPYQQSYQQPYQQPYQQSYQQPYQQPYQQSYQQPYQPSYRPPGKPSYASEEDQQDLSKIPGEPGRDYPVYHSVPETGFSCASVPFVPGIYANVETGCQAYHVCHDGREGHQGASFLCSNGTLFDQKEFTCNWWYKVDCREAPDHYRLNAYEEKNPFTPKAKSEEAKSAEDTLPGLKYYKPNRQGPSEYSYKQSYQQPFKQPYESPYQQSYRQPYTQPENPQTYRQPYKQSYQQPYKPTYRHLYKQPQPYQQYEQQQQEYQDASQQSRESYDNSQERNYHPDRFYKKK